MPYESLILTTSLVRTEYVLFQETTRRCGMAKNPPKGPGRRGAVRDRSQTLNPNGHWTKRDAGSGRFLDQKADDKPFKGVRKEH
jgi:hypothetical protein